MNRFLVTFFVSPLAACLFAFLLTACESSSDTQEAAAPTPVESTPTATPSPTATPEPVVQESSLPPTAANRQLAGAARTPLPKPPAPPLASLEDFLVLENGTVPDVWRARLEIRDYAFGPGEADGLPEVKLRLYNLQEDEDLSFEIRTLFFREDGSLIDATDWTGGSIGPRRAHLYRAQAYSPYAATEQVQLRLVN